MIRIYGGWPTRAFRAIWAAEELELTYEVRPVNLMRRHEDVEFIRVNPAGFLPVLQDGEVTMVESVAMIEYLAAKYDRGDLAPGKDDPDFAGYLQFLHLGEASLSAYLNIAVASRFFAPEGERNNYGVEIAKQMFFARLALVARRLAGSDYLAAGRFTAADISVGYALDMAERLSLADRFGPDIQAYRARLAARPAYQAADARSRV
jgi:glutathione S-transferase